MIAGRGFLRNGLDHMHKFDWSKGPWLQPALANMAIGVELLCKSFLAGVNPLFIFNKIPPDVAWAVQATGERFSDVPYERLHTLIEVGGTRTIGLAECIALLQARFPKKVQQLGEWGRRLSGWRAVCVHFVLPPVETRAVERVAFAALSIAQVLAENTEDPLRRFSRTRDDNQFIARFDEKRARDLDARVAAAKNKAKDLTGVVMIGLLADEGTEVSCRICGNDGIAFGERATEGGYQYLYLNEFACDECGLQLLDAEEMEKCGFETMEELGPYEPDYD